MFSLFNRPFLRLLTFGIIALIITAGSLLYSNYLVSRLSKVEEDRIMLYKETLEFMSTPPPFDTIITPRGDTVVSQCEAEISFAFSVQNRINTLIPTILADSAGTILAAMNLGIPAGLEKEDSLARLKDYYLSLKEAGFPAPILVDNYGIRLFIYYDESTLLKRLRYFPLLQLIVIAVFIFIVFVGFISAKRSEQNKVWVGLAKETAHQLGTPVSSMMAWVELLKLQKNDPEDEELIRELEKDVERLKTISERFSKIGSHPELYPVTVEAMLERSVGYISKRMSRKVKLEVINQVAEGSRISINPPLFDWVIENLLKNALDAMGEEGRITLTAGESGSRFFLEVQDTGKGMPKHLFRQVFTPGFTTKKRGWGLGLSLTKRIVENYHGGRIYVKWSEVGKGTIFRIELPDIQ